MNDVELLDAAQAAFKRREMVVALELLERLRTFRDSACDAPGHLLRGLIYEYGGPGVDKDLAKAEACYRSASDAVRNSQPGPFLYLARVKMKQGAAYEQALRYLREAEALKAPDIDLAYAYFYENAPEPNLEVAKRHYLKAAVRGRFAGFFGYASLLRRSGNSVQATIVDGVRILLGPFLFIVLGKKARNSFNGYE